MTADTTRAVHSAPAAPAAAVDAKAQAFRSDALSPLQLLRQLDGWLDNTGHDGEHPWRVCIAGTLTTYGSEAPTVKAADAAELFRAIAEAVSGVHESLPQALDANSDLAGLVASSVAHAGWLADAAAVAHGGEAWRGDAAAWLLPANAWKPMQAAELATRAEGGAA